MISVIIAFLSVFGVSFDHCETEVTDLYISRFTPGKENEKTAELGRLFGAVMAKKAVFEECREKKPFPDDDRITAIFFQGEECNGKPCRVFAYVGFPKNASPENPVPAMVLVHGGAGHAYAQWVKYWVDNGYAAISLDGFGQIPVDGAYKGDGFNDNWSVDPLSHPTIDEMRSADKPLTEQWFYYYISDVIMAHNIMLADSRVDSEKIGITGISWGGIATSVTICYDDRFAFAVPVYGCGYLHKGSAVITGFMNKENVYNVWDPYLLLGKVKMPVLWVNGDSDPFFSCDCVTSSAATAPNGRLVLINGMLHGQDPGAYPPEILRFANEQNGISQGNIKITKMSVSGGRAVLNLDVPDDVHNLKVKVFSRKTDLEYDFLTIKEEWQSSCGTVAGNTASVEIPADCFMYYIAIEGSTGSTVNGSTVHASTGIFLGEQSTDGKQSK